MSESLNSLETRLNNLEHKYEELRKKMNNEFAFLRRDIDRLLDGTDESPGVLRKLDGLDKIIKLLEDRLPEKN